jgi:transposase
VSISEASTLLDLSERQIKRLRKDVSQNGKDAVVHGNTGRPPSIALSTEQRQRIVELYSLKYQGANFQHFTEMLSENEGIVIGVSTVKRFLRSAGIKSPRFKRKPKTHIRRRRRAQEGSMAQTDATPYDFFGDGNRVCLHGIIDDATGKILGLYMTRHECLEGYFAVFEQMIVQYGIPASIYADCQTIFASPKADKLTVDDELAGIQANDTQLGRACRELGITLIKARSPQAKGRIERLWGTLQDRLTLEFRVNGITDIHTANRFLSGYILRYNRRFAVEASDDVSMFTPNMLDLDTVLCVREKRKTNNGGVFSFHGQLFVVDGDIPPRTSIEVVARRRLGIFVLYKERRYAITRIEKPKHAIPPPTQDTASRTPYIPPDSHYHKHGKEIYIHYSNEYTDREVLGILDEIFSKSFK